MVKLHGNVSDETYKQVHAKILELSTGSVYGKSQIFVSFAIEHLLAEINDGDAETVKQLKKALAVPIERRKRAK